MTSGLLSAVFPHGLHRWGLKTRLRPHRADNRNRNAFGKPVKTSGMFILNLTPPLGKEAGGLAGRE